MVDLNTENLFHIKEYCGWECLLILARMVLQGLKTDNTPSFLTSCSKGKYQRWSFLLHLTVCTAHMNNVAGRLLHLVFICIALCATQIKFSYMMNHKFLYKHLKKKQSSNFYFKFFTKACFTILAHFSNLVSITQYLRTLDSMAKMLIMLKQQSRVTSNGTVSKMSN